MRARYYAHLVMLLLGVILIFQAGRVDRHAYAGLEPTIPDAAEESTTGLVFVDVPPRQTAPLYLSPTTGGVVRELPGGTVLGRLGTSYHDGHAIWQLVRDPAENDGWVAEAYLGDRLSAADPPSLDETYVATPRWDGEIAYCVNPDDGPPGLDGERFVALVERVSARWQESVDGVLPLVSRGRCTNDPSALGDSVNAVGWVDDLGLAIAGQAWPDIRAGTIVEIDIRLSRGYFLRLLGRDPTKTLETCIFSTLVHEFGHLLGLDHPRSRSLDSSMQGFGASACDKGYPSESDRANLLLRYAS